MGQMMSTKGSTSSKSATDSREPTPIQQFSSSSIHPVQIVLVKHSSPSPSLGRNGEKSSQNREKSSQNREKSRKKKMPSTIESSKVTLLRTEMSGTGTVSVSESIVTSDGPPSASRGSGGGGSGSGGFGGGGSGSGGSGSGANRMPDKEELEERFAKSELLWSLFCLFCLSLFFSRLSSVSLFCLFFSLFSCLSSFVSFSLSSSVFQKCSWPRFQKMSSWPNK